MNLQFWNEAICKDATCTSGSKATEGAGLELSCPPGSSPQELVSEVGGDLCRLFPSGEDNRPRDRDSFHPVLPRASYYDVSCLKNSPAPA